MAVSTHDPLGGRPGLFPIVRMHQVHDGAADELVLRVTQHLLAGDAHEHQTALRVHDENRVEEQIGYVRQQGCEVGRHANAGTRSGRGEYLEWIMVHPSGSEYASGRRARRAGCAVR